jgi:hypothetical protein
MSDLADIAAARTAGYTVTRLDRGSSAGATNRHLTTLEKWLVGGAGQSGFLLRAYGESNSSSALADTAALESLNAQRAYSYAGTSSIGGDYVGDYALPDFDSSAVARGGPLTTDVN